MTYGALGSSEPISRSASSAARCPRWAAISCFVSDKGQVAERSLIRMAVGSCAMSIREVSIRDDSIRLGQFLKLAGLAEDGSHAKDLIEAQDVTVNDEVEVRRGRQLRHGDVVAVDGEQARLVANR